MSRADHFVRLVRRFVPCLRGLVPLPLSCLVAPLLGVAAGPLASSSAQAEALAGASAVLFAAYRCADNRLLVVSVGLSDPGTLQVPREDL